MLLLEQAKNRIAQRILLYAVADRRRRNLADALDRTQDEAVRLRHIAEDLRRRLSNAQDENKVLGTTRVQLVRQLQDTASELAKHKAALDRVNDPRGTRVLVRHAEVQRLRKAEVELSQRLNDLADTIDHMPPDTTPAQIAAMLRKDLLCSQP